MIDLSKKFLAAWLCVAALAILPARAQSPVTLTVQTEEPGVRIPDDFLGLSFGMKALLPGKGGAYLFSPSNTPLATLFRNIGLRHLRVGGTTVESPVTTPIPGTAAIDGLFAFARAAGVNKIIYSLRLLQSDPAVSCIATNIALARYIEDHEAPQLEAFSIGNEPDRAQIFRQDIVISNFPTYLKRWREMADAIAKAVPAAKFAGPDGGSGESQWTPRFARAEADSGLIDCITEHFYAGGKGKGLSPEQGIESMLSPRLEKRYQKLYKAVSATVVSNKFPYRFTEANDHYSGGVRDASDTFAGALWALDFLHWWAAHGAQGVDFHNTQWVPSDIVRPGGDGVFVANPKAYGLKAFDLGGHGADISVRADNPDKINVTAYAVRNGADLFVTVINKTYGAEARAAAVTIGAAGFSDAAEGIRLAAPGGSVAAKTGAALGGDSIDNSHAWHGQWSPLSAPKAGRFSVEVPAASAIVVKLSAR